MVSISEFKQAFASSGNNGPVKERGQKVEAALLRLKTAVEKSKDGKNGNRRFQAALTKLVERFAAAKKQAAGDRPGDAAAELDEIQRQTEIISAEIDAAPKNETPAGGSSVPGTVGNRVVLRVLVQGQGQPIPGAIVWVGDVSERSGSDGWARLSLTPGTYPYQVSAPGYQQATGRFEITDAPEQPDSVYLFPIEQASEAEVIVRVRDKVTRRKIDAALIRLGNDVGQTDSAGDARFIAVEYGDQAYHVSKAGYEASRGTLKTDKPKITLDVELQPARTGEQPPEVEPPNVTGDQPGVTITLQFNVQAVQQRIANALVTVGRASLTTDSDGNAEFTVAPGVHRYTVSASGFQDMEGALEIAADDPQQHHGVILHPVESHEGDATIRVLDAATRRPLPECTVRLGDELGRTDAAGEAKFLGVRYDVHRLIVMRKGYENHVDSILHAESTPRGLTEVELQPLAPDAS